jgi:hypothetical protein
MMGRMDAMAEPEWTDSLPRSLKLRLEGLGSYVTAILDETNLRSRLSQGDLQRIQLAAFLRSLDEFLREGSQAAAGAVDAFAALGIEGVRIGSELFSGRNAAVLRGRRLSEQLRGEIHDSILLEMIIASPSLRDLVLSLARRLGDGRTMDRG